MIGFFWASGHIDWLFFAILVFSGLWLLLGDLVWRVKSTRFGWIRLAMSAGWVIAIALMVWVARRVR
ncbi:MAG TPA: hypothetical protein VJQ86_00440 [Rhodanobacteraceae bacterium]|nr:hypothetical protein [Rhodanobacteraceae bacterium]